MRRPNTELLVDVQTEPDRGVRLTVEAAHPARPTPRAPGRGAQFGRQEPPGSDGATDLCVQPDHEHVRQRRKPELGVQPDVEYDVGAVGPLVEAGAIADTIRSGLRADDLIARFGADSFVFTLHGSTHESLVARINAIIDAISEPKMIEGKVISATVSAGGDIFLPTRATTADATLTRSEVALSQARIVGHGRFLAYDPAHEATIRMRRDLEKRILWATENERFEVFYQPLLHQKTREFSGFEALLRLPDGDSDYISPADFVPVAEEMGLINRIGAWTLGEAMRTALEWPAHISVSVNLSARQFEDGAIVGTVKDALARNAFPTSRLILEVTETVLMEDGADVAEQLMDLRMLGISIAMDDFGIGYSSLGYLWKYGFDKIKIDRSFVAELGSPSGKADDVVATIIMLGHKLDMTVTAEGIETALQVRQLAALGCDEFQGYYFGKPVPRDAIREMLEISGRKLRVR